MSDWGYLGQGLSEAAKTVGPLYLGHLLQGERDVKLDKMQLRRDDILGKQAIALQKERIDVDKVLQTERLTAQSEEAKLGREFTDKDPSGFVTAKDLVKVSKGELAKMSAEERAKLVSEAKVSTQAEIDKYNREHAGAVELKKMELEKGSVISKKEFDALTARFGDEVITETCLVELEGTVITVAEAGNYRYMHIGKFVKKGE